MNILFLGGDRRYRYMIEELSKDHTVSQIGFNKIENAYEEILENLDLSKHDIILFPISGINDKGQIKSEKGLINIPDTIFKNINKKTKFFTGLKTAKLLNIIPEKQIISFLDYPEVKKVNDSLTVDRCNWWYKR